eukprot:16087023-Heterocapsa_arctica.AAC.1
MSMSCVPRKPRSPRSESASHGVVLPLERNQATSSGRALPRTGLALNCNKPLEIKRASLKRTMTSVKS